MRLTVASALVIGCFTSQGTAFQARAASAAGAPAIKACSLLSKELVAKYWNGDKRVLEMLKSQEEPIGTRGSACEWGTIGLQVDPFTPQAVDDIYKKYGKEWTPVAGVGDRAYFRNNRDRYAELLVVAGGHTFTIQMGVPTGSTAEATKPHTIEVAKAILPKLQ
jgi:hypothetical protein